MRMRLPRLQQQRTTRPGLLVEPVGLGVHPAAAHPRLAHDAAHLLALVRAAFVAEEHGAGLDL